MYEERTGTGIFRSQKKLLRYIPIVAGLFVVQLFMGGYLAHLYTEPSKDFLISQDLLPFNVIRSMHTQIAILWVAVGWLDCTNELSDGIKRDLLTVL